MNEIKPVMKGRRLGKEANKERNHWSEAHIIILHSIGFVAPRIIGLLKERPAEERILMRR